MSPSSSVLVLLEERVAALQASVDELMKRNSALESTCQSNSAAQQAAVAELTRRNALLEERVAEQGQQLSDLSARIQKLEEMGDSSIVPTGTTTTDPVTTSPETMPAVYSHGRLLRRRRQVKKNGVQTAAGSARLKEFRDEMKRLLTCEWLDSISENPVCTVEGYVTDGSMLRRYHEGTTKSPFSGKVVESTGYECQALTELSRLTIEAAAVEDDLDDAQLRTFYARVKALLVCPVSGDVLLKAVLLSTGHLYCSDHFFSWDRTCPVTGRPWDGVYVWSRTIADICKLVRANRDFAC